MHWLINNPEIIRHVRSRLRRGRVLGGVILYLLLLFLISYIMYYTSSMNPNALVTRPEYMRNLYFTVMGIQYFVSLVMGSILCSNSIVSEREKHAYDFLRMLPISTVSLSIGKLIGTPIVVYLLIVLTLPVSLICVLLDGVSGSVFLVTHLILITAGLFTHSMGLFFSSLSPKSSWANAGTLLLLFTLNILTSMEQLSFLNPFRYFGLIDKGLDHLTPVSFYMFNVSGVLLAVCVYLFFTFWFLLGISRNIMLQEYRLLSKGQGLVFFTSLNFLIMGLIWPYLNALHDQSWLFMTLFLAIALSMILSLIIILAPTYDDLVRWFHYQNQDSPPFWSKIFAENRSIFPLVVIMNLVFGLVLLFMLGLGIMQSQRYPIFLCFVFFSLFSLTYALMIQLLHTWWSPFNRNYLALGILTLSLVIPIFGGEPELFFILNPVFIFSVLLSSEHLMTSLTFGSLFILIISCLILYFWYQSRLKSIQSKLSLNK